MYATSGQGNLQRRCERDDPRRQHHHRRPPPHGPIMAFATDSDASRVRKPVELIQRYPCLSLHEELMDVTLDYIGDRACLGPSPMELYFGGCSHNERTVSKQDRAVTVDHLLEKTVSRLGNVEIDFARVTHLRLGEGDDGTASRRMYHDYLLGSPAGEGGSFQDDDDARLDEDHDEDDEDHSRIAEKRCRSEPSFCERDARGSNSDPGLHGANVAIRTAPSMRNTISTSMPRRLNQHKATHRLCVVPIVSLDCGEASAVSGGGLPAMVYLRRVVDRALARELEQIDGDDGSPPSLKIASVLQAMDASDELVRSLKRQRSRRGTEQLLLDEHPMLLGSNLTVPVETLTDDALRTHVTTVLRDYMGTVDGYFTLRLLTMHYMRQRMMDPLDGIGVGSATAGCAQGTFVSLGGAVLPSMEAVRAAQHAKEEHLRHCGIVDTVEFYSTIVAFALIQDPIFATALQEDGGSAAINASKLGAFSRPPETVTIPHALAVYPDGNFGGGSFDGGGAASWYTYQLEAIPKGHGSSVRTGDCKFCCSRESFELTMVATHLREAYLTVVVEKVVRVARRRCAALPALRCYERLSGAILAEYRTAKFASAGLPSNGSPSDSLLRCAKEQDTARALWALQQEKRFSILFLPFDVLDGEADPGAVDEDGGDDDDNDEVKVIEVCPKSLKKIRPPNVPLPGLMVHLLHHVRNFWQVKSFRPFPAVRLRDAMMACGVSLLESNGLIAQIALDVQGVPALTFDWRSADDDGDGPAVHSDGGDDNHRDDDGSFLEDVAGAGGAVMGLRPGCVTIKPEVKLEGSHRTVEDDLRAPAVVSVPRYAVKREPPSSE